jgi:putative ABC transport system permease protein
MADVGSGRRSGAVPLGRRNLFAERRWLLASMVGVGLAVMLILLLDGLWSGLRQQTAVYTDHAGAQLYVLQPGIRDLTAGASAIPLATLGTVRSDPEVDWATPVRTAYVILSLHGRKVAVYVIGSAPGDHGGAWSVASGRAPRADDEVTVGALVARRHGIGVGDRISVMGTRLRVVGTSRSSGFMLDYVFVTHRALSELTGTRDSTSAILIGTSDPSGVARRLRAAGVNVLSRDTIAQNNLTLATGIFGSPIRLMVGIGLAAGTLIIALTAYTVINERRREYGILKALGATRSRLVKLALAQTLGLAGLGLVAGLVLFLGGRALIVAMRPQFQVLLTLDAVGRAAGAALLMALVAAILPARRLAALEPAAAFRSQT